MRIIDSNICLTSDTPEWYVCVMSLSMAHRMFSFHHVTWDAEANYDMDWFILPAWLDFLWYTSDTT